LGETEPIVVSLAARAKAGTARPGEGPRFSACVSFNRHELDLLLSAYGRKVVAGEWRDYAIDALSDRAVFSVYRRSSEAPLYRIVKTPKLARRQGAYQVLAPTGLILKRGHDLAKVLGVIDREQRLAAVG